MAFSNALKPCSLTCKHSCLSLEGARTQKNMTRCVARSSFHSDHISDEFHLKSAAPFVSFNANVLVQKLIINLYSSRTPSCLLKLNRNVRKPPRATVLWKDCRILWSLKSNWPQNDALKCTCLSYNQWLYVTRQIQIVSTCLQHSHEHRVNICLQLQ